MKSIKGLVVGIVHQDIVLVGLDFLRYSWFTGGKRESFSNKSEGVLVWRGRWYKSR